MKFFAFLFFSLVFSLNAFAQISPLATANNRQYTSADLPESVRGIYEKRAQIIADLRSELLNQQIADRLFAAEAFARGTNVEKLIQSELAQRVAQPTDAQIQTVYDANRQTIGDRTLAEARPQIVSFLRREPEQKALAEFVGELKNKHGVVIGKDVNAASFAPTDVLATVGGKPLTLAEFEKTAAPELYETQMEIYEQTSDALEQTVLSALISAEAAKTGVAPETIIAREVTDKMKDYTDDERIRLLTTLQKNLFQKYEAKFTLTEPSPFVQKISVDDDPSRGAATSAVTVVMFTDFQCPACAATHPVLESVLAEYKDKIRFVVRDYPLTSLHPDAFRAAQAAAAANAQGKFYEYAELLYRNQNSLDTASLKRFAAEIGLNQKQFDQDLDSGKFAAEVQKDMADGATYGINGTPTIFINGVKVRRLSAQGFRDAIERAMK